MDESKCYEEVRRSVQRVFDVMEPRVSPVDMQRLKMAYEFAAEAHKDQKRKSGHPYIIHPVAVALIAAEELKLDPDSVITAFLHDVVEDTPHTTDEIEALFGSDVAFLVSIVTKKNKDSYRTSKQVDNFKQLLDSVHYDIRALMVKLADRLHNMRTLSSMRIAKQMKIAGETDYFYAPLANRLGLFDVKTDLENLAFKYRCTLEYNDIKHDIEQDRQHNRERIDIFLHQINAILAEAGINGEANAYYRRPYSIWRRMREHNVDFKHVENRYYIRVTFKGDGLKQTEKDTCLRIYSLLTDRFKEKPNSFYNQIDQSKENSYQCIRVMLLSDGGEWEDVQICSDQMVLASKLGPMAELNQNTNIGGWLRRFKLVLEDMANQKLEGNYMESIVSTLYYDDIMVFNPSGVSYRLPKGASALDFAFELDNNTGLHARYARINGNLASIRTRLKQGDCIEIFLDKSLTVKDDWLESVITYNAKRSIKHVLKLKKRKERLIRCNICHPIPGGDIIGYKEPHGHVMVHRRSCPKVIECASQHGDNIIEVDFPEDPKKLYPVTVTIRAVDRYHLLIDIIEEITNGLGLPINSLNTDTNDEIVDCTVTFFVHSVKELVHALDQLYKIEGVDIVKGEGIR